MYVWVCVRVKDDHRLQPSPSSSPLYSYIRTYVHAYHLSSVNWTCEHALCSALRALLNQIYFICCFFLVVAEFFHICFSHPASQHSKHFKTNWTSYPCVRLFVLSRPNGFRYEHISRSTHTHTVENENESVNTKGMAGGGRSGWCMCVFYTVCIEPFRV